jgi:hypothetical protein
MTKAINIGGSRNEQSAFRLRFELHNDWRKTKIGELNDMHGEMQRIIGREREGRATDDGRSLSDAFGMRSKFSCPRRTQKCAI